MENGYHNRNGDRAGTMPRLGGAHSQKSNARSVPSLKNAQSQGDVMDEARALRLHKQRLEHRSRILEQQNEQLELQLQRLKKVIDQVCYLKYISLIRYIIAKGEWSFTKKRLVGCRSRLAFSS